MSGRRAEIIGDATLYLGDCREVLEWLGAPGVEGGYGSIVSDPPYGIGAKLGMGGGGKGDGGMWAGVGIEGDEDVSLRDAVLAAHPTPFAVFASPRRSPPPGTRAVVCWDKGEHTGAGDLALPWKPSFELVHIGGHGWRASRRGGGVVRVNAVAGCVADRNDGKRFHPFEKPVEIMRHFCERAPPGAILDPFMGSGTTGVAALQIGRRFVGIELDPAHFDMACRRLEQAWRNQPLFAEFSP